jgi:beta-glucosidase
MTNFLWGAATSSHQIDGYNKFSDWWQWEQQGMIDRGECSGSATDHWNRFREDLDLASELGLTTYRFSIEWARLEPQEGHWDTSVLCWYEELLNECEKRGILPMATLHHFTIPAWLAEKGGFTWPHSPQKFADYVKRVAHTLGPRIPLWCTLNEPMVLAAGQYLAGIMPPAKFDPPLVGVMSRNLLSAHVSAYDILHSEIPRRIGPWRHLPLSVGIAHNMVDFLPAHHWHPMERYATQLLRRFFNRSWLDAVTGEKQHFGAVGLIPYPEQVSRALGRKTVDFIGVNYYTKAYLRWEPKRSTMMTPENFPLGIQFFGHEDTEVSDLGWAVHPEGLGRVLRFVKGYGLPMYITENGIADAADKYRPKYLVSHLKQIATAIQEGADIRGYYHWSLLDNFEWIKGFTPRFGLLNVNYETFERTRRESFHLYKEIIGAHMREGNLAPQLSSLGRYF